MSLLNTDSLPLLARSGQVHLKVVEQPIGPRKILITAACLGVVAVLAATLGFQNWQSDSAQTSQSAPAESELVKLAPTCAQLVADPKTYANQLQEQQQNPIVVGGVRSSVVLANCDGNSARFRRTEVKDASGWQLTNLVQLEN